MKDCCKHSKKDKKCIRKSDKKTFQLPRRFSKKKCKKQRGFTMRSSCAPYKDCFKIHHKKNQSGGSKQFKIAYFSAGCFWGAELKFSNFNGVINTVVGYMGGKKKNPTYKKVCKGDTHYAETVKVIYDPTITNYTELVNFFFKIHDPTTKDRQGVDIGSQYRSIAFYNNKSEKETVMNIKKENKKIVTEILDSNKFKFNKAELKHQQYKKKQTPIKTENRKIFNKICINNEKSAEKPFSGKYSKQSYKLAKGIYICPNCKNNLYHSNDIYDSGTGWPAFSDTIDGYQNSEVVILNRKNSELKCAKCKIHLGHRLYDGPTKTKIHDCINSVCLHFKKINIKGGSKKLTKAGKQWANAAAEDMKKRTQLKDKRQFLFNPNNPDKSFDVYIDKDPSDTIPIKYKTIKDVKETIQKLEKYYKSNQYPHKRIWKVGMILKVRLEQLKEKKKTHYKIANRYFKFLKKRTKIKDTKKRKKLTFKI